MTILAHLRLILRCAMAIKSDKFGELSRTLPRIPQSFTPHGCDWLRESMRGSLHPFRRGPSYPALILLLEGILVPLLVPKSWLSLAKSLGWVQRGVPGFPLEEFEGGTKSYDPLSASQSHERILIPLVVPLQELILIMRSLNCYIIIIIII